MASFPEKTFIIDKNNVKHEASAPLIVSASRSTDIPAFYGEWFSRRLDAGYVKWINPFNNAPFYVPFEKARFFVFWSKNPRPFFPVLDRLASEGIGFYVLYTVNNYDGLGFEPGVPPLSARAETFAELSRRYGKERVVWRFDPLLLTDTLDMDGLFARIREAGDAVARYTEKLVFSFCEISKYPKVERNLRRERVGYIEFDRGMMLDAGARLAELARGWGVIPASCAVETDLAEFGIVRNKCIDDELIARISPGDRALMEFLGRDPLFPRTPPVKAPKDKGQRKYCGCVPSKDIGRYDTCPHYCVYCYANTSRRTAAENYRSADSNSESVTE
ncbi:MAG: hypothetical protein A2X76_12045 [Lysobacterales bacterium GWF1_69_6]|nr:MAG: hypothetical protein A2X76_12045 [Xanthomonadales bacterium GWF1_69_6]